MIEEEESHYTFKELEFLPSSSIFHAWLWYGIDAPPQIQMKYSTEGSDASSLSIHSQQIKTTYKTLLKSSVLWHKKYITPHIRHLEMGNIGPNIVSTNGPCC